MAKRVLTVMDDVKFIIAGSGDRFQSTVDRAAEMGIGHKVLFAGFLRGDDVARAFGMADLYVMPSVTEPFGIAPLEAIAHGVPVIISKTSGVSEVLKHALKVDYWDIEEMANKVVAVLRHPPLASTLQEHARTEIGHMTWEKAAGECLGVYRQVCESCLLEDQTDRGDFAAASSSCMP
jgi:glycosyltransferase involved in cell wall biosynthesis